MGGFKISRGENQSHRIGSSFALSPSLLAVFLSSSQELVSVILSRSKEGLRGAA